MFSLLVILYLFLGGLGGGLLCITSVWSLVFHSKRLRTAETTNAFDAMKRNCFLVGFLVLAFSAACLIADMGRPDRVFMLFTRPTASVLTFGSYVLALTLLVSGILVVANFFSLRWVSSSVKKVAEFACAVLAFLVIAYTGIYLLGIKAVTFWVSIAIPVLFIFSSLSSGLALLFLIGPFSRGFSWMEDRMRSFHVAHMVLLVFEAIVLGVFLWGAARDPFATASVHRLFEEGLQLWFLIGAVGLGIVAPIGGEVAVAVSRRNLRLLPFDVFCILGAFCLRYCIISAGLH